MKVSNLHEAIGTVSQVKQQENTVKLTLSINKLMDIPAESIDINVLNEMIGERICLFRCDDHFYIRRITP